MMNQITNITFSGLFHKENDFSLIEVFDRQSAVLQEAYLSVLFS